MVRRLPPDFLKVAAPPVPPQWLAEGRPRIAPGVRRLLAVLALALRAVIPTGNGKAAPKR